MGERLDFPVDEAAHRVAEGVMLCGIEWAFHRAFAFDDSSRSTMAGTLTAHLRGVADGNAASDGPKP
jgi:hypothetical protein